MLSVVIVGSFAALGYFGRELYRQAPSIPGGVVTAGGRTLYTDEDIREGQNVWRSIGGQEAGTVWVLLRAAGIRRVCPTRPRELPL